MSLSSSELLAACPAQPVERSAYLRDRALGGNALELGWSPILSELADPSTPRIVRWVGTFRVSADALRLGTPSSNFRATFTDQDQITIAAELGLSRTTPRLADLAYLQSPLKLAPQILSSEPAWFAKMNSTAAMDEHSRRVDLAIPPGLAHLDILRRPVGKDWCASNANISTSPSTRIATNYGWHYPSTSGRRTVTGLPGVSVRQGPGQAHNWHHTDYSQTATFVHPTVTVLDISTGRTDEITLADLNDDPILARLWSHEGTIREGRPPPTQATLHAIPWIRWAAAGATLALGVALAATIGTRS